jgi:hypothetical protein
MPRGVRPEQTLHHYRTIAALPLIMGMDRKNDADYLETCRRKRNVVEYDRAGEASDSDAEELLAFVQELTVQVMAWLKQSHPDLT